MQPGHPGSTLLSRPGRKEGGTDSYSLQTIPPRLPPSAAKAEPRRGAGTPEPIPAPDGVSGSWSRGARLTQPAVPPWAHQRQRLHQPPRSGKANAFKMSGNVSRAACQSGDEAARDDVLGQAGKLRASANSSLGRGACSRCWTPAHRPPVRPRLPRRHAHRESGLPAPSPSSPVPLAGGNVLGRATSTPLGQRGVENKQNKANKP